MGGFGQRLRELRNLRGISQNELSKHIGVSKSSVNMYERGEREPSFETLEAVADYFNVNIDYLLGRESLTIEEVTKVFDPTRLSDSARLILSKILITLGSPHSSEDDETYTKESSQLFVEMIKTFTPFEREYTMKLFKSISDVLQGFVDVDQTE